MANFIAICHDCEKKAQRKAKRRKKELTQEEVEELILFETAHSIKATDEEIREALTCPRCNGTNCEKTFIGYDVVGYVRGNGYLDRAGAKRDMHLFHLTEDDPYAEYRVPGEVEEMKTKIKKAGQHDPKRKHYDVKARKAMEKAVKEVAATPDPPATDQS